VGRGFFGKESLPISGTFQLGGPPLFSCPRLPIRYVSGHPSFLQVVIAVGNLKIRLAAAAVPAGA